MIIPEQVTTKITVKSRTEVQERDGRTGYKLECDIPLLYGPKKLPVLVWGCPEQDAPKAGEVLMVTLTRGKQSDSYDGTAYWHYAWRWGGRASDAAPEPEKAPTPATGPARPTWGRDASIEQQVASKNRTELAIACLQQAVVYHDRLPDVVRSSLSWTDVVTQAREAYEAFCDEAEVQGPEAAPDEGDESMEV